MPIPRVHLFEWNEIGWAPAAVREGIVESLSRMLRWGGMVRGLVAPFQAFLAASGATEVLELCSGAAGPTCVLAEEIKRAGGRPPRFLMTDLFPQPAAWEAARAAHPGVIDFVGAPVDATRIPRELGRGRARVIINAFHHFPPEMAREILADAVRSSQGIFVSEPFERNPLRALSVAPVGLAALAANPVLCGGRRLEKAVLTWGTPVALATGVWDTLVSTLRVYTERELRGMVETLGEGFGWRYGMYRYPVMGVGYYFWGVPRKGV